jgi:hypothetical protein
VTHADAFGLMSRYFWAVGLVVTLANYLVAKRRVLGSTPATARPEAARYLRRFGMAGALPWALMGVGYLTDITPTVWYYFRPQDLNPFVVAWFACIFALAVINAVWVLGMGGAEKVREHRLYSAFSPGYAKPMSVTKIKLIAALGPPFFLAWLLMAVSMDAPHPPL